MSATGGFRATNDVLTGAADQLRRGADAIDSLADSVPAVPDSGAVQHLIAALMADLTGAASTLGLDAEEAARRLVESHDSYVAADQVAAEEMNRAYPHDH